VVGRVIVLADEGEAEAGVAGIDGKNLTPGLAQLPVTGNAVHLVSPRVVSPRAPSHQRSSAGTRSAKFFLPGVFAIRRLAQS
jgi:hypothetical protein